MDGLNFIFCFQFHASLLLMSAIIQTECSAVPAYRYNVTAVAGSAVSFNCTLDVKCSIQRVQWRKYLPSSNVPNIWSIAGRIHPSVESRNMSVEDNPTRGWNVLTIPRTRLADHGRYRCFVAGEQQCQVNFQLSVTASRNVSTNINSSIEFNCSLCTSNITWSYMPSGVSNRNFRPLQETQFADNERCQIKRVDNRGTGWSQLSIGQAQFADAGTYLCSAGTLNQTDYCEMSFNFTVVEFEQSGDSSTPSVSVRVTTPDLHENGKYVLTILAIAGGTGCLTMVCAAVALSVCFVMKSKRQSPTAEVELSNEVNGNVVHQSATINSADLYSQVVPPSQRSLAASSAPAAPAAAADDLAAQTAEAETPQYAEVVVTKKRDRQRPPPPVERPPPPVYAEITHQPIYFNQI